MRKKLELHGTVENGILRFPALQLDSRNRFLNSSPTFSVIEILGLPSKNKSQAQLGAIFGLIIETVKSELDGRGWDILGSAWTREQIRQVLYRQWQVKHNSNKTLSKMDMAETSTFIDSCYQWLAGSPLYIFVPDPRPQEQNNER
jgi:hypothetical protein